VNLLLFEPGELTGSRIVISDRRAHHLRTVLGVQIGDTIRAGELGGRVGGAKILSDDGSAYTLEVTLDGAPSAPWDVELVLAVPRPKVITRTLEIVASFAVKRIDLTNAWRVDKSYLRSPRLDPQAMALAARFGAEQGATTHVPTIELHDRLMALLEGRFAAPGGLRLVAHPKAPPIEQAVTRVEPTVLAIGPEGGWIERELETFVARGFQPVSLGAPILRVEAGHRFVEEEHLWIVQQRLGEAHALQHALRELAKLETPLRSDAHAIERGGHAAAEVCQAEQPAVISEQLLGAQVVVEVRVLREVSDALPHGDVADGTSEDLGAPARRKDELHEQLERRGLAGAVGTEKPENVTADDVNRQAIQRAIRTRTPESDRIVLA